MGQGEAWGRSWVLLPSPTGHKGTGTRMGVEATAFSPKFNQS